MSCVTGDIVGRRRPGSPPPTTPRPVRRRWLVTAAEGTAARDVVVDATRVYVTGQGNVGHHARFLTVVAYDRATGARLWRTDKKPADATDAAGLRMDLAPDGSLVVAGQAARGFLDWYTVAFETTGAVRWEAVRDGGLNTDEIPARRAGAGRWHDRRDRAGRSRTFRAGSSRASRPDTAPNGTLLLGGVLEDGHRVGHGAPER